VRLKKSDSHHCNYRLGGPLLNIWWDQDLQIEFIWLIIKRRGQEKYIHRALPP
jgi:hypothetical protein